jgi:hypothetical protein
MSTISVLDIKEWENQVTNLMPGEYQQMYTRFKKSTEVLTIELNLK